MPPCSVLAARLTLPCSAATDTPPSRCHHPTTHYPPPVRFALPTGNYPPPPLPEGDALNFFRHPAPPRGGKVPLPGRFRKRLYGGKGCGGPALRLVSSICKPGAGGGVIRFPYRHKGNTSGPAAVAGPGRLRSGPAAGRGRGCRSAAEDRGCRTGAGRGCFSLLPVFVLRLSFRASAPAAVPVRSGAAVRSGCGAAAVCGSYTECQRVPGPARVTFRARPWARLLAYTRGRARGRAGMLPSAGGLLGAGWGPL